jgi:DNA polymerase V
MFALVDCNNFYASCERLFKPDLHNKPIVVLSNNDGCVIARSNEAKKLGIPMGAPTFQWEKFFTENNVNVFSSNYPLYADLSDRVMSILRQYSPDIEIYSIDESFLKFDGFESHFNLREHCLEMRTKVKRWTSIPISIGIAPTKALSKVANRVAKKYPSQTKGVHIIDSEEKRIKALKWLAIEDVWGIGRRHAKRLRAINVNTAYDFTQLPTDWVKKHMTIVGVRLQRDLQGKPTLQLDDPVLAKKNIATTRSFPRDITTFDGVRDRVSTFAISNSEKLRRQNSDCQYLIVFLSTNFHKEGIQQYHTSRTVYLPYATNDMLLINHFAIKALKSIFKEGYSYKRAGVIVGGIKPMYTRQLTLFDGPKQNIQDLMSAIDKVNTKYHRPIIKVATQDLMKTWDMKQLRHSPHYTTKLSDVIIVR